MGHSFKQNILEGKSGLNKGVSFHKTSRKDFLNVALFHQRSRTSVHNTIHAAAAQANLPDLQKAKRQLFLL